MTTRCFCAFGWSDHEKVVASEASGKHACPTERDQGFSQVKLTEAAAIWGVRTASWGAQGRSCVNPPGTKPAVTKNGRKRKGKEERQKEKGGKGREEGWMTERKGRRKSGIGKGGKQEAREGAAEEVPGAVLAVPRRPAHPGELSVCPVGEAAMNINYHDSRQQRTTALSCFVSQD